MSVLLALAAAACGGGSAGGGFAGSVARGTGGGSGVSGGSGGSGGALAPPNDAHTFCVDDWLVTCDLVFRCVPGNDRTADFTATFGSSLSECQNTIVPSACATAGSDCPSYDAVAGKSCITGFALYGCNDFYEIGRPAACDDACPISPGTGASGGQTGSAGASGSGGVSGTGGRGSGGATSGSGGSDQLPLCPSDYESASCPTAGVSCRLTCDSGLCGCTCQSLGDRHLWSCVIF